MDLKHNMMVFICLHCKLNMAYLDKCNKNKCNCAAKYAWSLFVFNSYFIPKVSVKTAYFFCN